jgi:hypothetical protein
LWILSNERIFVISGLNAAPRNGSAKLQIGTTLKDFEGSCGSFREALSEHGQLWTVGLSRCQNVYPADVRLMSGAIMAGSVSLSAQGPVIARSLEERHVAG